MSATGLPSLDQSLVATKEWLKDVQSELRLDSQDEALKAIGAVLQTLRDRLTVEEATDLAAQLPMLLQGVYYHNWNPVGKPLKLRSQQEFLEHVSKDFGPYQDPKMNPRHITRGVLKVLARRVTQGEILDVKSSLPADILTLWPEAGEAA